MSLVLLAYLAAAVATPADDAFAIETLNDFSECVAQEMPDGAREVLAMDYRTDDYQQKLRELVTGNSRCIWPGSKLRGSSMLFAGGLAEVMFEAKVPSAERSRAIAFDPQRPPIAARSPTEEMALCLVLRHPAEAAALLAADPASKAETAALKSLAPSLQTCLARGVEVQLKGPAIRSLVALAAWRVASASAEAAGGVE